MMERKNAHTSDRKRLNWVDWAILGTLFLGLMVAFFALRTVIGGSDGADGEVFYTVLISNVDETLFGAEAITVGVPVRSANGTVTLGSVTSWRREGHREATVKDGIVTSVTHPDRFDYYVTVSGEGVAKTGEGIRVGDIRIAAGMPVSLRVGGFFAERGEIVWVGWETVE